MWKEFNPNYKNKSVGDCVIRAICAAMDKDWGESYLDLCLQGYIMGDMPTSNVVWGAYLKNNGFSGELLPDECPNCYTVKEFCVDHSEGVYVLGTGSHAVAVIDGCYWDAWDSGNEQPIYLYKRRDN